MAKDKSSSKFLEQAKHFKDEQKKVYKKKKTIFNLKCLNLKHQKKIIKYFLYQK